MLQRHTTKPQTLRFSSHTSLFWTLPEQLSILHHACVPTHPEDTPQNLRPQDFHLTHPSFELCRSSSPYYTTHVCQPWTNVPKIHHKTSDPKIFISHIPVLNFAGTDCTSHVCQPWTNIAKTQHKTSDPIFISHIPVNFAGAASITTHVSQPILNQRPKTHYKFQSENFHLTHPCFELCRNRLHHACAPTLNQCCKDIPQNLRP